MPMFHVDISLEAASEEAVEQILHDAQWIDSYGAIEEVPEEVDDDDDDDEV